MLDAIALLESYDRQGMLGQLTGISLTERDRLFKTIHAQLSQEIDQARERARQSGTEVLVDASRLSGVNHGELLRFFPDGRALRELTRHPAVEQLIAAFADPAAEEQQSTSELNDREALERLRPLLARAAYNGLWSPSGTNWQPIRTIELTRTELARLAAIARTPIPVGDGGLALLARTAYESMLGDVAILARIVLESQAEYIDSGIFSTACELTAASAAQPTHTVFIGTDERAQLTESVAQILRDRRSRYTHPLLLQQAEIVLGMIERGEYVVDGFFCPPQPDAASPANGIDSLPTLPFDELVAARSSQRVASPSTELSIAEFEELWQLAMRCVSPAVRKHLHHITFDWHSPAPKEIGQAMFDGLYGVGADPESGEGGRDGWIGNVTIDSLLAHIVDAGGADAPGVQTMLRANAEQRAELAASTPMPAAMIPRRMREFMLSKPQYELREGEITNRGGRPLTMEQLVRMVRLLALSFGRFFLSFQNTHPITAVILADKVEDHDLHARIYRGVGQLSQALTVLCRARGLVSIIKGGPTEINRPGVGAVVARHTTDNALRQHVLDGRVLASLTFQVGHPLGPDEPVKVKHHQHSGLAERVNDKRLPRDRLLQHYFPYA